MADLKLVIGSKNSSSWSLRPWLLLKQAGLDFEEVLIPLRRPETAREIRRYSPSGKVPVLLVDGVPIWDLLAICEFAAEQIEGLWPEDARARALARSVSAEMHAGFADLRTYLPLDVTSRFGPPGRLLSGVSRDVERIQTIWRECRQLSATQGPFLFGQFTVADAMYAPVAFRFHTYQVPLNAVSSAYVRALLELPAMQEWAAAAQAEVSGGPAPTLRLGPGPEGAPPSPGGQGRAMPAAPPPAASGRADAAPRPAAPARPAPDSRAMMQPEPRRPEPQQAPLPQPESPRELGWRVRSRRSGPPSRAGAARGHATAAGRGAPARTATDAADRTDGRAAGDTTSGCAVLAADRGAPARAPAGGDPTAAGCARITRAPPARRRRRAARSVAIPRAHASAARAAAGSGTTPAARARASSGPAGPRLARRPDDARASELAGGARRPQAPLGPCLVAPRAGEAGTRSPDQVPARGRACRAGGAGGGRKARPWAAGQAHRLRNSSTTLR